MALSPTNGKFRLDKHGCRKSRVDDPWLNYTPIIALKDYMKVECVLTEENYDLIEEADFFEQLEFDDD
jgi:hypothetical protein